MAFSLAGMRRNSEPALPTQTSVRPSLEAPRYHSSASLPLAPRQTAEQVRTTQNNARARFMNFVGMNGLRPSKKSSPTELPKDLQMFYQQRLMTAEQVVNRHRELFKNDGRGIDNALLQINHDLNNAMDKTKQKDFEKNLVKLLGKHLKSANPGTRKARAETADRAKALYGDVKNDMLNNTAWNTIEKRFEHGGHNFVSTMTPAAQMKRDGLNIFEKDYDGKGVCSGSTREAEHATNLYASRYTATDAQGKQQELVKVVRHGINSAYGLEDPTDRAFAALSRSKEVVTAALELTRPDALRHAIDTGEPVSLRLGSTSLVTPFDLGKNVEGSQLKDQVAAWETLNALSRDEGHITINTPGKDGKLHEVKVRLETAPFNFAVNEAALTHGLHAGDTYIGKLDAGWEKSDEINRRGLGTMLGESLGADGRIGGWVGDYLENNPHAENAGLVRQLAVQAGDIYATGSHHYDKNKTVDGKTSALGDPYKMASRIALLSQEIGAGAINCKSGKDRTAMLLTEMQFLKSQYLLHGTVPMPGEQFSDTDRKLYHEVLLNTGNGEVQQQNTGARGNKVFKTLAVNNLSIAERVGDKAVWDQAKGLSGMVKS